VYWQVAVLGVAVAVAVVILGLAVFMPPAPPAPPQLYVKVVPSGSSYLLYVNDSGKALREVWYSKNGGPLLMANGPIRAECGDRVEVVGIYADGSRQTASAVVKCSKPFVVPPRSEPKPDVATFTKLSDAMGEAANGLMGNLPYRVYVKSASCSDLGATFDVAIQPLPYGTLLGIKYAKVSGTAGQGARHCNDFNAFCISATTYGFTLKYVAPYFCSPGPCTWSRDATYTFWVNYTAPGTSALASDYQGEAKTNATTKFFGKCEWITYCGIKNGIYQCWNEPVCTYTLYWNGQRIGYCEWTQQKVTETVSEAIRKRYNETCLPMPLAYTILMSDTSVDIDVKRGYEVYLADVNINGQTSGGYAGVACVKVWYRGNRPEDALNRNNWVNWGFDITYAKTDELYKGVRTGETLTVKSGYEDYVKLELFGGLIQLENTGTYVHTCYTGLCRLYKYFDPEYIAGYRVYNVTRLVGFTATSTGSAGGAGFGLQIPDLYFIATTHGGNYNVNKTSATTAYINGQQVAVYQVAG